MRLVSSKGRVAILLPLIYRDWGDDGIVKKSFSELCPILLPPDCTNNKQVMQLDLSQNLCNSVDTGLFMTAGLQLTVGNDDDSAHLANHCHITTKHVIGLRAAYMCASCFCHAVQICVVSTNYSSINLGTTKFHSNSIVCK